MRKVFLIVYKAGKSFRMGLKHLLLTWGQWLSVCLVHSLAFSINTFPLWIWSLKFCIFSHSLRRQAFYSILNAH